MLRASSCTGNSNGVSGRLRLSLCINAQICAVCTALVLCFSEYSSEVVVSAMLAKRPTTGHSQQKALQAAHLGSAAWGYNYTSAITRVYLPHGYTVCPTLTTPCWLQLSRHVDCSTLWDDYINTLQTHTPVFPSPKELPGHQRDDFLLQNLTHLSALYIDQPGHAPNADVPVWTLDTIKDFMQQAAARMPVGHYGDESLPIYQATECHPIKGLKGAIFGSEAPWLEGILLTLGAAHLTTIEFRTTVSRIPNHRMMKPLQWAQELRSGALPHVDFVFSFSSWEHDGLGRYGDPVNPWGDIEAMQRASCYVKPGGLLYFAAPASNIDQIQYNAHRIYGPARLPLLSANWAVLGVFDDKIEKGQCGSVTCDGLFTHWRAAAPPGSILQPVIVIRNMRTRPCSAFNAGSTTNAIS